MRLMVFSRQSSEVVDYIQRSLKISVASTRPSHILTYGGDGTLLMAERRYPGIPKLPVRGYDTSAASLKKVKNALTSLEQDKLDALILQKLAVDLNGKTYLALNEVVVRSKVPTQALRFRLHFNGRRLSDELMLADGVIVSTAFGSHAYFQSITRRHFKKGIGLAAINPTAPFKPLYLKGKTNQVTVEIERETALVHFDNHPTLKTVKPKQRVVIKQADAYATVLLDKTQWLDWAWSPLFKR